MIKMVKEAEVYLSGAHAYLESLKTRVQTCTDHVEKKKLESALEQDRLRFAQMMADVVIFKASQGIFTTPTINPQPIESKKLK